MVAKIFLRVLKTRREDDLIGYSMTCVHVGLTGITRTGGEHVIFVFSAPAVLSAVMQTLISGVKVSSPLLIFSQFAAFLPPNFEFSLPKG